MNCTTFQNQFGLISERAAQMQQIIESYLANPNSVSNQVMQDTFYQTDEIRQNFIKEYQGATRNMLKKWFDRRETTANGYVDFLLEDDRIEFEANGRVAIKYGLTLGKSLNYLPSVIRKIGSDFWSSNVISADYLEEVERDIDAGGSMQSMQRLRYIGRDGRLFASNIKNLDSLIEVGGNLAFHGTTGTGRGGGIHMQTSPIESLKSLKRVGHSLNISETRLTSLPELEEIGGYLRANDSQLQEASNLHTIGNAIYLVDAVFPSFHQAFPSLKEIGTDDDGHSILGLPTQLLEEVEQLKESGEIKMGTIMHVPASWEDSEK